MQCVRFQPGVLHEVFGFMKLKVKEWKPQERECCLTLDEMAITASVEFDASTGKLLGDVTMPDHSGQATHALVFMLGGITTRWKQVVGYHYTGNSINGIVLKAVTLDVIRHAADVGLHVVAVTSDMGSANRAMWKSFGIVCGKYSETTNKIQHPCDPSRFLYFIADVPHVIKNVKAALVNGQTFKLPDDVVASNNLSGSEVSKAPVEDQELKIAPKLTSAALDPCHFDKMKVCHALHFFSQSVSAGIRFLVESGQSATTDLVTAWFVELMNKWFDLMSSRNPVMALSKFRQSEYEKAIALLKSVINLFTGLKIGKKGGWKPVQTGVILATQSILDIQNELLDRGHSFILTSRFSQDCLENLFSCVRLKNPIPSPIEFRYAL